jgi:hypothetical protein
VPATHSPQHGLQELCTEGLTGQGWPKLLLELQELHAPLGSLHEGAVAPIAYGMLVLPCSPGFHIIACPCTHVEDRTRPARFAGKQCCSQARIKLQHFLYYNRITIGEQIAGYAWIQPIVALVATESDREYSHVGWWDGGTVEKQ